MNNSEGFLQDVVAKLVVDQTLNDEMDSWLQSLGVTQSLHELAVVIIEGAFEDFVYMMISTVQAFLNHV